MSAQWCRPHRHRPSFPTRRSSDLSPDPKTKRRRRVMVLLFQGEDAVRKVRSVVGNISADRRGGETIRDRSEEHTSELQSHSDLVCRLLLEKKNEELGVSFFDGIAL